jgi:hypothetical protein
MLAELIHVPVVLVAHARIEMQKEAIDINSI